MAKTVSHTPSTSNVRSLQVRIHVQKLLGRERVARHLTNVLERVSQRGEVGTIQDLLLARRRSVAGETGVTGVQRLAGSG